MAGTVEAPQQAPQDQATSAEGAVERKTGRSPWTYVVTPMVLGLALVALYLWVSRQDLDSIERRTLNADSLITALVEHLQLAAASTLLVLVIAIPLGIVLTRPFARSITPPLLAAANIGQAVPTIGVIALIAVAFFAIGFRPAVFALVIYAILPVLRNTMVGLEQVEPSVLEAGRGMGMTKGGVLRRIELPLAVPVILAGVRTALVINVGTATLATFINAGGLGDIINAGLTSRRYAVTLTGAGLTAVLALFIDYLAGVAEDVLRPRGL